MLLFVLYEKGNVILVYYFAVLRELEFSPTIIAISKTKNQEIGV